jgi:S1-C subfamily serine protease
MKIKFTLSIILIAILAFGITSYAFDFKLTDTFKYEVNGVKTEVANPYFFNNRIYLSLRETSKLLNKKIDYNEKEKKVSIEDKEINYKIKSTVKIKASGKSLTEYGSGFFVTENLIVTALHVVKDKEIKVIIWNGNEIKADIYKINKNKDIAILKVDGYKCENPFEISNRYKESEEITTISYPLAASATVTFGNIDELFAIAKSENNILILFTIKSRINFGSSGGIVLNRYGECIGIIHGKDTKIEDKHYIIPAKEVKKMIE